MRGTWLAASLAFTAGLLILIALPRFVTDYTVSLLISILSYVVLASAWALFSGSTRYISLATAAFFGVGAYLVAIFGADHSFPLVLGLAALVGFLIAFAVGLSTLRLTGVYFVIFTFGLSELIRQVTIWWEINRTKTLGRHVFVDVQSHGIYYYLLGLAILTLAAGFLIQRSRLGVALRAIGEDETVANHLGINTTIIKVTVFAMSAVFMSLTGAIMAPRWSYLDPNIAFNPLVSFLVVIMALLGGAGSLYGPLLGAVPLVLLFEFLSARLPYHSGMVLGLSFLVIVYYLPFGVVGALRSAETRVRGWLR